MIEANTVLGFEGMIDYLSSIYNEKMKKGTLGGAHEESNGVKYLREKLGRVAYHNHEMIGKAYGDIEGYSLVL